MYLSTSLDSLYNGSFLCCSCEEMPIVLGLTAAAFASSTEANYLEQP